MALPPQRRGVVRIARVRIATAHPFALFRAWTWVHAPLELIVYPSPAGTVPMPAEGAQPGGTQTRSGAGLDEWVGLRAFRDGDSPRQVDWKAYAREAPLLVKEYQSLGAELRVFDFARVPLEGTEARLAQLARWVVDAEARGERYALRLPGAAPVAADRGPQHRHRCLALLARFGTEPAPAARRHEGGRRHDPRGAAAAWPGRAPRSAAGCCCTSTASRRGPASAARRSSRGASRPHRAAAGSPDAWRAPCSP